MFHVTRPAWHRQAACRGMGPDVFFPAPGRTAQPARAICADCPVAQECSAEALADHGLEGVWGGLTVGERDALRARGAA